MKFAGWAEANPPRDCTLPDSSGEDLVSFEGSRRWARNARAGELVSPPHHTHKVPEAYSSFKTERTRTPTSERKMKVRTVVWYEMKWQIRAEVLVQKQVPPIPASTATAAIAPAAAV